MSSLLTIPTETLTQICLHLPLPRDAKNLATTCRALWLKLGESNNHLWYTRLSKRPFETSDTFPHLIPEKYDAERSYYKMVHSIMCTWRHFREYWSDVEVPSNISALTNQDQDRKYIHFNDALFLIKEQLSPEERSAEGRFLSKWNHQIKARIENEQDIGRQITDALRATEMGQVIESIKSIMRNIYSTQPEYRKFHKLQDVEGFWRHLERGLLQISRLITMPLLESFRERDLMVLGFVGGLFRIVDESLRTGKNEDMDMLRTKCSALMSHSFGLDREEDYGWAPEAAVLTEWFYKYTDERTGQYTGDTEYPQYAPYQCPFCDEAYSIKDSEGDHVLWDGAPEDWSFTTMGGLVGHIFKEHEMRFEEDWRFHHGPVLERVKEKEGIHPQDFVDLP
ncbi:hypothetical protein ABW20_dc0106017 [Dactylellina cionopaga]|nr:hypothetical protein ABW20_dc0106017 [Dactylellina cionopaga]